MPETPAPVLAAPAAEPFDPRRRRLCADGNCVGVVGPDGRCRVCGLAHPEGALAGAADLAPLPELEDAGAIEEAEPAFEPGAGAAEGGFVAGRALCPDGSCVGVIGDDGRCKVCGRSAEAAGA